MRIRVFAIVITLLLSLSYAHANELRVAAASDLRWVMPQLVAEFSQQNQLTSGQGSFVLFCSVPSFRLSRWKADFGFSSLRLGWGCRSFLFGFGVGGRVGLCRFWRRGAESAGKQAGGELQDRSRGPFTPPRRPGADGTPQHAP